MSNSTSQAVPAKSESAGSPTPAASSSSSAAQQPAASSAETKSTAPTSSAAAAAPSSASPQQPASSHEAPKAPTSSAAAAATSSPAAPNKAAPTEQKAPAPTSSTTREAAAGEKSPTTTTDANQSVVTVTPGNTSTRVEVITSTTTQSPGGAAQASTSTSTSSSDATTIDQSSNGSSGLSQPSKVAIGVVVPIVAIAVLAILGLFWWKKRRARQEAEEERRKEVEDYAYNPNADPTIPSAGQSADHPYEMREDSGSGYRGWGSTAAAGSMGRKPSTTMSGGGMVSGYSDPASPTRGNPADVRSGEPLLDGACSPEGEILGAMGPAAANNRGGDMRRGPSNASSSYSVGARSEGSEGGMYGNGSNYYEQYGQNPYGDQRPQDAANQAVIRDNPARRNTRIENSAHYPQQSAGIAQNF